MKTALFSFFRGWCRSGIRLAELGLVCLLALSFGAPAAHAGLTFDLDFYRNNQGQSYVFYTPLYTNSTAPAAPLGTYFVRSPHWPTNGSQREFELTTNGLNDVYSGDGEYGYGDFATAMQQITNGTWSILFTNATTTNLYTFTVSAPNMISNMLPATIITFPADGAFVPTNQPTFTWQGPSSWAVSGNAQVYNNSYSYFQYTNLPAAQNSWTVPVPFDTGYTFRLQYVTNYTTPVFVATTPLSTNNSHQAISGWASTNTLETGSSVGFSVFSPGSPSSGHTNVAYYSFEDNNLFAHDFSGSGNDIGTYSSFSQPPHMVTNDGAAGIYSVGFGGSGWLNPPTNLLTTLAGSFSVSLWLKTTDVHGNNNDSIYSAAGIVSAFTGPSNQIVPMALNGSKLAFYTGGDSANLLHSQTSINTGQYVHLVTTRDQQTGEKRIYVNGVLDSSLYAGTDLLIGPDELDIGYNNGQVFTGEMDEIQFYAGVLSDSEVAYLHANPGSYVTNTVRAPGGAHRNIAHYAFDNSSRLGQDFSGRGNDIDCGSGWGSPGHQFSTDAVAGGGAIQFYGASSLCVYPASQVYTNFEAALGGSFSISAWVKTTASRGNDNDDAISGATIFWAYNDQHNTNDTIPLAITGSKAAFSTRDHLGVSTTLHSTTSVNNGVYHHIAVTRNVTGEKKIYVDGNLQGTEIGTAEPLNGNNYYLSIGGTFLSSYTGLLDDVQVYSGVLSSSDVAYLYHNPGSNVVDTTDQNFNAALNTTGLVWVPSGDSDWLVETTNSNDNVSAAQSGSVINDQTSTLSVTVTGPGTLTFYWSSIADDPNGGFYYEFDLDNGFVNSISGDNSWWQDGPFTIPAGQHTLSWTAYASGDTDPTQAGFLDQVSYVVNRPVTLLNPQTAGSNFQFQFLSQAGFTHAVQYRTNLVAGSNWQTYSTVPGDGTLKIIPIPLSVFSPSKQGFVRVTTQ